MAKLTREALLITLLSALVAGCGGGGGGAGGSDETTQPPPSPPPSPPTAAQALEWRSAVAFLGSDVFARGVAPGPSGSFYVVGSFGDREPLVAGALTAASRGGDDIFVARVAGDGQLIWLKSFGATSTDIAFDVDSDAQGNLYLTGTATGRVAFDQVQVDASDGDALTVKMAPDGAVVWVRLGAGVGRSAGNEVATRPDGTVAVVGPYSGVTSFGSVNLPPTPSGRDLFVTVYDSAGSVRWSRALIGPDPGGSDTEAARGVAFDPNGRVLVTGVFTGSLSVDGVPTANINASGTSACFIGVFQETGAVSSFRPLASSGRTTCRGIVGDSFGNLQLAGKFTGTLFAPPNALTSAGQDDLFVASLDEAGGVAYSRRIGGPGVEEGSEIESFADGEVFTLGDYSSGAEVQPGVALTSAGARDLLLSRFGVAGESLARLTAGGAGNDVSFALAVQPDASVAVVGTFGGGQAAGQPASIVFGSRTLSAGNRSGGAFFAVAGPGISQPTSPPVTPPPASGLNIQAAADYARSTNGRTLVVLQNEQIVFEQYSNGGAADKAELLASGSKSFSCALAAAAKKAQVIPDFNVLASTRLASWAVGGGASDAALKSQINVRDLIDLSSGLSTGGASGAGLYTVDSYAQAINVRSSFPPDTQIVYTPNGFQAFLAYFELASGGSVQSNGVIAGGLAPDVFLQDQVFTPIQTTVTSWRRDINGKPILAGGANMTARDWARYGQLVLQRGRWNGQQLLPADVMGECGVPQTPQASNIYGLGFWLNLPAQNFNPQQDNIPLQPGEEERLASGGQFIPTAPADLFYARGAGNMKLFIIPSRNLVIARQGGATDDVEFFRLLFGT